MAYPALFRNLFGDEPVRPFKFRKELIPLDVDKFNQWYEQMETWRKSLIGCLIPTTMVTLPSCLGIPDGSLFLFEDYPELKEKYDAGGFNGMLLESTATSEEKDAWRGKWIKHPQGIGLYAPRLQGLFLRGGGTAGKYNQAGLPNLEGSFIVGWINAFIPTWGHDGCFYASKYQAAQANQTGATTVENTFTLGLRASNANAIYGASSTVMPTSANMAISIYLGRTA